MKKYLWTMMVLALAACSSTEPTTTEGDALMTGKGVSNPNTPITASFTIYIEGHTVNRPAGPITDAPYGGSCDAIGRWTNSQTRKTSANPHPHCVLWIEGQTYTVTFSTAANYVLSTSGNVELNFPQTCTTVTNADLTTTTSCTGNSVQYKKNGDYSVGFGGLNTTDALGNAWTIDFAQPSLNAIGNVIVRNNPGTLMYACIAGIGCGPGFMTW